MEYTEHRHTQEDCWINKKAATDKRFAAASSLLRLGELYIRLDNYPKVIEVSEEAMDWYKTLNQLNGVAQAQLQLAEIHRLQHEHTRAVQLYSLAYERFNDTEDYRGMVACLHCIGIA